MSDTEYWVLILSYCSLKPLWSAMGEVVPARTSPTLHPHTLPLCSNYPVKKCPSASIVVTSTLPLVNSSLSWVELNVAYQHMDDNGHSVSWKHYKYSLYNVYKLDSYIRRQNIYIAAQHTVIYARNHILLFVFYTIYIYIAFDGLKDWIWYILPA